jgi:hypothetical protein
MAFEVVEHRIAGLSFKPVSMRLLLRKTGRTLHDSRPACKIGIRKHVAADLGWKHNDPIRLELGTGTDAGKIRLTVNKVNSIAAARVCKGGLTIDLGHIPQFGMEPRAKKGCDATVEGPCV